MNIKSLIWPLSGLGISAAIGGLLYQRLASVADTRRYPPPGQLIYVGECRLHLYCMGQPTGRPSVVLEGGLPSTCLDWCKVMPAVAQWTQVCAYDRAGFGWSDSGRGGYTSSTLVQQLHDLLSKSSLPAPYILVGHSFGGLLVRLYASTYPQEVAGLVLVDSTPEDLYSFQPELAHEAKQARRQMNLFSVLAPFGVIRLAFAAGFNPLARLRYPPEVLSVIRALFLQTRFTRATARAFDALDESMAQVRASRSTSPPMPLVVLSQRTETEFSDPQVAKSWHRLQRDLLAISPASRQIIAEESGHYIQLDQPELVIAAIKSLVLGPR